MDLCGSFVGLLHPPVKQPGLVEKDPDSGAALSEFNSHFCHLLLCCLGQVPGPLCAPVSVSVKRVIVIAQSPRPFSAIPKSKKHLKNSFIFSKLGAKTPLAANSYLS